jgi:c-di-AMP phosphodiesterase-like protein
MNNIKIAAEDLVVAIINKMRDIVTPVFNKYTAYYRYVEFFIYGVYAIIILGVYNTVPAYIPLLRNTILYITVFILLVRFNRVSWNNPKFAILGGNTFSEFDRKLIMSSCMFIFVSHVASEALIERAKQQVQTRLLQPVLGVRGNISRFVKGDDDQ